MELIFIVIAVVIIFIFKSVKIVPEQEAWVVEKLGKFDRVLVPGLNFIIPIIENVAYEHNLKELPVDVHKQTAITQDNVSILIDGIIYIKILDAKAASYGVSDPIYAITQLAQTVMRSEIGKLTMDRTFEERNTLNANIVHSINDAAGNWGVQCMRYELKDISPPKNVLEAMELQVAAERRKRAEILDSEGKKQSIINIAEADKAQVVLESEGAYQDQVNRAKGGAEAILEVATATALGIEKIAKAIQVECGSEAASLNIAEKYIDAFANLAKKGNTIIVPANANDVSGMLAQAISVFKNVSMTQKKAIKSEEV
jgi:regulator of protease activity HflC (stomatin/prohibitin superfamily)